MKSVLAWIAALIAVATVTYFVTRSSTSKEKDAEWEKKLAEAEPETTYVVGEPPPPDTIMGPVRYVSRYKIDPKYKRIADSLLAVTQNKDSLLAAKLEPVEQDTTWGAQIDENVFVEGRVFWRHYPASGYSFTTVGITKYTFREITHAPIIRPPPFFRGLYLEMEGGRRWDNPVYSMAFGAGVEFGTEKFSLSIEPLEVRFIDNRTDLWGWVTTRWRPL